MISKDLQYQQPVFFITGNSRSGTTMMMRIMNNHTNVHSINEPHFFEKLWSPDDAGKPISSTEAFDLYAKLFTSKRAGFFEPVDKHIDGYRTEINVILDGNENDLTRLDVYAHFIQYEAGLNGKEIPCEKTPQNVFYLKEILEIFPNARVINMIRDPRGVMLSQKRKWRRRSLGADFLTRKEMLRLRINYHPITISKLWSSAIHAVQDYEGDSRVLNLKFEDLLQDGEQTVTDLCAFLDIDYQAEMMLVPHAGSSTEADNKTTLGIKKTRANGWLEKGLNPAEIAICQGICKRYMAKYGYDLIEVPAQPVLKLGYFVAFPFKLGLALLWNLNRMRSIGDTLRRRLLN
jgi:hypothetical protein